MKNDEIERIEVELLVDALHRRYGFMLTLSSAASSILDQRSVREIRGLCGLFGMTGAEVNEALSSVGRMIEPSGPVGAVR